MRMVRSSRTMTRFQADRTALYGPDSLRSAPGSAPSDELEAAEGSLVAFA